MKPVGILTVGASALAATVLLAACGTMTIDNGSEVALARKGLDAAHAGPTRSITCSTNVEGAY